MVKGWVLPVAAGLGLVFAAAVSVRTERAPVPAEPIRWPPSPPFDSFIAGAGIVEAQGGNITIGSPIAGIVTAVAVDTGHPIRLGDLLFEVDNRPYVANQATAQASLEQALANLEKLIAYPRAQEKSIAAAELEQARAQADQARARLNRIQRLADPLAISATDREAALYGAQAYSAQEKGASLRLSLAEEGTWERDLAIGRASVKVAEAQLSRAVVDVALTRVTSPLDGVVLYRGVDPGNYVGGPTSMVVGATQVLRVRTDIDEVDAWRFHPESPAYAYLRGNSKIRIPLKFDHYESLVQPKRSLTLANDERVDTRVLQVIYTFEPKTLPVALYVGQLLDVFIESIPVGHRMKPQALPAGLERINESNKISASSNQSASGSETETVVPSSHHVEAAQTKETPVHAPEPINEQHPSIERGNSHPGEVRKAEVWSPDHRHLENDRIFLVSMAIGPSLITETMLYTASLGYVSDVLHSQNRAGGEWVVQQPSLKEPIQKARQILANQGLSKKWETLSIYQSSFGDCLAADTLDLLTDFHWNPSRTLGRLP